MSGDKTKIPDDTKLFLRAVLVSSPGMLQSLVMKEYFEITGGEKLKFTDYGFKNLYEFLVSLEGEVTRIEFSPKHGENLIYAILDKSKYQSKHAEKYANKQGSSLKGKSPEEILEWRKTHKVEIKSKGKSSSRQRRHDKINKPETKPTKEAPPSDNEWLTLRKLLPNSEGLFRILVKQIGVNKRHNNSMNKSLKKHFDPYNVSQSDIKEESIYRNSRRMKVQIVSFRNLFTAYRAWKEKDRSILAGSRIGIEPYAGSTIDALTKRAYKAIMHQLPKELLMSTLVALLSKYTGLMFIDPNPKEQSTVAGYSTKDSAEKACKEISSITVNGEKVPILLSLLDEKPPANFDASNHQLKAENEIAIYQNEDSEQKQDSVKRETPPETVSTDDVNFDEFKDRACGFSVDYELSFKIFRTTCKRKPTAPEDISDDIQFLMTHPVDPCRFWGWIMNGSYEKLLEIEKDIDLAAKRIQPPDVLPRKGDRGAALYKDEDNETWYRCYVLSSDEETDKISVFYCDYGNSEEIPRERFCLTYNQIWSLPPQAVPLKIYNIDFDSSTGNKEAINNLTTLFGGQLMEAKVMKGSVYSQPHIIEIKDIRLVTTENPIILDDRISDMLTSPSSAQLEGESKSLPSSLFDYDEDELVLGLLSEAHNPNLLYLKLGDMSTFSLLEKALHKSDLHTPYNIEKGDILLLSTEGQRRRVLILYVMPAYDRVKVLHVDYGVIEWTSLNNLYHLTVDLQDSPFQARPGSLAGIDCKRTMSQAIEYLKGKSNKVIKANVIKESSNGKVLVELFNANTGLSLNKEMIDKQLAVLLVDEIASTDEELSPHSIPIEIKELPSLPAPAFANPRVLPLMSELQSLITNLQTLGLTQCEPLNTNDAGSERNMKLNTNGSTPDNYVKLLNTNGPLQDKNVKLNTNGLLPKKNVKHKDNIPHLMDIQTSDRNIKLKDDTPRLMDIQSWINNSPMKTDGILNIPSDNSSKNDSSRNQLHNNNKFHSYPPPDIISSAVKINRGLDIEDRKITLGDSNEVLDVNIDNKLDMNQIEEIREKWILEKESLMKIKDKAERAMNMSNEELMSYFRELKKEKLALQLSIKIAQNLSNNLEAEYKGIVEEENQILSLV